MNFPKTNLNLYQAFLVVYETKNITKAAKISNISRSAINHSILKLGNQLGVKLFTMMPRGVEPTSAAIELYNKVKFYFDSINYIEENLKEFNETSSGILRLGCPSHIAGSILKDHFCKFNKKYPKMQIEFYTSTNSQNINLLEERKIDFVIDIPFVTDKYNFSFETVEIKPLDFTFFASKDFISKRNMKVDISYSELAELPLVIPHRYVKFLSDRAKIELKPTIKPISSELAYNYVLDNIAVGFEAKSVLEKMYNYDSIVELNIVDKELPKTNLVFVHYKDYLSKPAKAFLEQLKKD